ncbi:MAG: radical SAM protein [Acidobacteriota bacterium]|nr:radical SAM protein [Acidobacteriota bacterium]
MKRSLAHHPLFRNKAPLLGHLDIELTERCNNACIHCFINLPADDTRACRRELKTDQWKDILREAAELGALSVRFTGGEPLLREDFAELYVFARKLGLKVVLFTNGRLITPALADLLARIPPLMKVEISVYGMHPESYDAIACTPGAFAEFRRGLDLLSEQRIPFVVKSTRLPANLAEIEEFETWAATVPSMDHAPPYSVFLDLRARRDSPAKNRHIAGLRISPEEAVALMDRQADTYCREMARFSARFMRPQGDELFSCGAGQAGCVDAYGVFQMCLPLRHPDVVYGLNGGSLRQALTETFPIFRKTRATNPEYLRRCARCFLKGLCLQCPAKSWTEHGTLDTPVEYLCRVAHAQARYLGLLKGKEKAWDIADWRQRIKSLVERTSGTRPSAYQGPGSNPCQGDPWE